MPMSVHIANGMFGGVVIEPRGLAPADHSYLLVQSEQYRGPETVDADEVAAEEPDAVVFNDYPNQYDADPPQVRAGDRSGEHAHILSDPVRVVQGRWSRARRPPAWPRRSDRIVPHVLVADTP